MRTISLEETGDRAVALLTRLMRGWAQYQSNYLTRGMISIPQLWALQHLRAHRLCTMRELATAIQSRESTATGLVDRMAKLGLVRRSRSTKDRRVVLVGLAPKGRRAMDQIAGQRRRMLIEMFRPLRAEERERYIQLMERMVNQLSPTGTKG